MEDQALSPLGSRVTTRALLDSAGVAEMGSLYRLMADPRSPPRHPEQQTGFRSGPTRV
jgi:hypothetical protein